MAIKIFSVLLALFSILLIFVGLQEPLNFKSYDLDFKNIEAKNLSVYELNASQVRSFYAVQTWTRYAKKDVLEHFVHSNRDFNVSADFLELLNGGDGEVIFEGNVSYESDGLRLSGDRILYYPKEKRLYTHTDFKAFLGKNVVYGKSLDYKISRKILEIKGVNAWLIER